jgi:hypothetical protein
MYYCVYMKRLGIDKKDVVGKLGTFSKEAHASSLASGIMRTCNSIEEIPGRIKNAKAVVAAVQKAGVSSFYSAEYAKVFSDPKRAVSERARMASHFKDTHGLNKKQANKMADCVVFCAAKTCGEEPLAKLEEFSNKALALGVPFTVVADAVYYAPGEVDANELARRMVMTSIKQNKPLDVSQTALAVAMQTQ